MALRLAQRVASAPEVQQVLTKHGCLIRTRLGLHEIGGDFCAEDGLIILQLCAPEAEVEKLKSDLTAVNGVTVKTMCLS
jgi:hypothetical protein